MPKAASKETQPTFVRVAVEGATVDGRTIQRVWLTQAAANYDPDVKGARVWVEHMRSMWSDSPFSAQGDVIALKAEEIKTGKLAGKMALFAAIKPLPDLVELNKKGKKIYSSIEIEPKFADTGEAYLTGLAVTDDPASLGVEMLKFHAKTAPAKFSSAPLETALAFSTGGDDDEEDDDDEDDNSARRENAGLLTKLLGKFGRLNGRQSNSEKFNAEAAEVLGAVGESIESLDEEVSAISKQCLSLKKSNKALRGELDQLREDFTSFKKQMDETDGDPQQRKPATGANADAADC
nr:GPO family capsid scaffolding protein [Comamonas testosteroni]